MLLSNVLKPGMKGVFYGRYSTDKQEMLMQQNSVENLAKKYSCSIIKEYLDPGVSALKNNLSRRKGIQSLLDDAKEKKFDFIAVYKNDRLAREPFEHQAIRITMRVYDIPIVVSSTESLYDNKKDTLLQLMEDGFSKYEIENIKQRTLDGKIAKAKSGVWQGGTAPYGYAYDKRKQIFISYPEEIELVKQIFNLYLKGEGFKSIAETLPRGANRGKDWSKEKVKSIITNPFYAGFICWGKRSNDSKNQLNTRDLWVESENNYIEPVISREEWEICWQTYQNRREKKVSPKAYKTSFLLKDIAFCKHCNCLLTPKDQRTRSSSKVYGSRIYKCDICNFRIEAEMFHDSVVSNILNDVRLLSFEEVYKNIQLSIRNELEQLKSELKVLRDTLKQCNIEIDKIKGEIKIKIRDNDDEKLIKALTMYRLEVNNRIEQTQLIIKQKQREIELKENVELNQTAWNNILENVLGDRHKINNMDIRRLFVPLVSYVKIDKDNNIEYQLRVDNTKRKVSNQITMNF